MVDQLTWKRTHYATEVSKKDKKVIVMGWARAIRGSGKLKFIQLADRTGNIQVIAKKGDIKDSLMEKISTLTRESVIAIKGKVKENKEAPNGIEIIPDDIQILNISERLPIEVITKKTPASLDTRLDWRIIDLRKPEIAAIFNISDTLKRSFFDYFDDQGFIDVNTPLISGAAAEGGASMFEVDYFGKKAYLNQSPQLYKQMLLSAGFDKVTIVSHVFRAEPHETTRHINEIVQLDIEEAFIKDEEDALKHFDGYFKTFLKNIEKLCKNEFKILNKDIPKIKFPIKRLSYDNALKILKKNGVDLKWGEDFTPEAEREICKVHNPVIITKWPNKCKPFYCMEDKKYSKGFDLLFNGIEISSGAQREHRYDKLIKNMKDRKLNPKDFEFYLSAFKYGMPPHAGWSIGLERLTMALLGLTNIRESVLFPRTKERLGP